MTAVVDTDFLIAQLFSEDSNHQKANAILSQLEAAASERSTLYLPVPTLSEFTTIATIRADMRSAHKATELYSKSYTIFEISAEMAHEAVALLQKQASKENSLFDCYVMVAARYCKADCILSFDKGYRQNKFMLYEEYSQRRQK